MKVIGVVPARMAASRFPGKVLYQIQGKAMIEHVYHRAKMYDHWDSLVVATCDKEIKDFCKNKRFPVILTGSHHTRALDRVAEAVENLQEEVKDTDIVVCVQGDEPMMRPDMIETVVKPLISDDTIPCSVLAMHITDKKIWLKFSCIK